MGALLYIYISYDDAPFSTRQFYHNNGHFKNYNKNQDTQKNSSKHISITNTTNTSLSNSITTQKLIVNQLLKKFSAVTGLVDLSMQQQKPDKPYQSHVLALFPVQYYPPN